MASFSITRRDGRFAGTVNETISSQSELLEAEREHRARGFGRVAAPLVSRGESPADLDARREVRLEARHRESDEAREGASLDDLDGEEPEAVRVEVRLDSGGKRVALVARERSLEVLHHGRVGVQRGERLEIRLAEAPQPQALRAQLERLRRHGAAQGASLLRRNVYTRLSDFGR